MRRLRMIGLDIDGPSDADAFGVKVTDFEYDPEAREFNSAALVNVRKHAVQVVLNPAITDALAYMPSYQPVLEAGYWGPIAVKVPAILPDTLELIQRESWLAKLYFVPVTVLPDP